jgi:ParB family chromosome partitioning protein
MSVRAANRFETRNIPIGGIILRAGACLPGGDAAVSRAIIAELVRGSREPLLVRPVGDKFELVARDLEYWIARKREEAVVECIVTEMDDLTAIVTRISEGAKRKDINSVEEAGLLRELSSQYGMTHQEIAIRCGRKQCTVSNKLRLLRLPGEVLRALQQGQIGERQARALLRATNAERQLELFYRCVKMRLTAEEMENLCGFSAGGARKRISLTSGKRKAVYKDPRIFQNTLRKIVVEMKKAGLDVVYREDSYEKSWEFKVLVRT